MCPRVGFEGDLVRCKYDPFTHVWKMGDHLLLAELQIDPAVIEQTRELLLVPKRTPDRDASAQAVELVPSVHSAVRLNCSLEQISHSCCPVWHMGGKTSRTLATCSSIAPWSPRPESHPNARRGCRSPSAQCQRQSSLLVDRYR